MDVEQTRHYVKIHCHKYIAKTVQAYPWIAEEIKCDRKPALSFPSDSLYLAKLIHQDTPLMTEQEWQQLEITWISSTERQWGNIMSPMIKCRLDISAHAVILIQFMNNPSEIHYKVQNDVLHYLA
jgi:hypothetical protein